VAFVDICVDSYVACKPSYTADVTAADKQDFWLGKVLQIDPEDDTLEISWWDTKHIVMRNLTLECSYVPHHRDDFDSTGWIEGANVMHVFPVLLLSGKIPARDMRSIRSWSPPTPTLQQIAISPTTAQNRADIPTKADVASR